jgi:hypothetical protein
MASTFKQKLKKQHGQILRQLITIEFDDKKEILVVFLLIEESN